MSNMVRLINKTARLYHLPDVKVDGKIVEGPRLIPGGNNVRGDYLEALIGSEGRPAELFASMLDAGEIVQDETPNATKKPEGPEPPKTLAEFKPPAALALVEATTDLDVLSKWASRERRAKIKSAITTRIAALGGSTVPGASEADEESE